MVYACCIIIVCVILIVVLYDDIYSCSCQKACQAKYYNREDYGSPPGMKKAVDHNDITNREGWMDLDSAYHANSASSMIHVIERSA